MKMKGSSYFLVFVLLLALWGIVQSVTFRYFDAMFVPLLASSVVFVMTAIELLRELRGKEEKPETGGDESSNETLTWTKLRRLAPMLGWIIGFFVAVCLFSFVAAVPVFVIAYLKRHETGWLTSIASAVILSVLMYVIFDYFLQVHLTKGLIADKIFALFEV